MHSYWSIEFTQIFLSCVLHRYFNLFSKFLSKLMSSSLFPETQHVCHPLLGVWSAVPGEYYRSTLLHGPLLWWWVLQLWVESHDILRAGTGGSCWPHGLCVPTCYEVHIPQVWTFWYDSEARFVMYSTSQHCQWEDIHISVVLVHHFGNPAVTAVGLSSSHNRGTSCETIPAERT